MAVCPRSNIRLILILPVSLRMTVSVAIQGTYRRQNTIKENADKGVKTSVNNDARDALPAELEMMASVLSTASLADSPAISAEAARQSPKPRGVKKGAADLPRKARMLSSISVVMCICILKFWRNHMMIDAANMIVNAFLMKPRQLLATGRITFFREGSCKGGRGFAEQCPCVAAGPPAWQAVARRHAARHGAAWRDAA